MRGLAVIGVSLALGWGAPALAGQPVELRASVEATGAVTLGDLFDNAGAASAVVIGNGAPVGQSAVLDAGAVQRIARDHGLDWDNPAGLQRILVPSLGAGGASQSGVMVDALTYSRSMAAGEVVQPADLTFAMVPRFSLPADAPRDAEAVIGKTTRRPLPSGAAVAARDLSAALVIKRDDVVEVGYHSDGISLVLQGKAMADAAAGEPVAIQNTASKKIIQAIASGPDQAVVGPEADSMRAAAQLNPSQIAALP